MKLLKVRPVLPIVPSSVRGAIQGFRQRQLRDLPTNRAPTITAAEQRALWVQVSIRMTAIDELGRAFDARNWRDAEELGREFSALLQLCDDLAWGKWVEGDTSLASPPDALRRAFGHLREMALYLRSRNEEEALGASQELMEARSLEETCRRVLEELDAQGSAQVGAG